jgi:LPS-assembly lipoprotein
MSAPPARIVRLALAVLLAAGSAGCGFHLRGEAAPRAEFARTVLEADRLEPRLRYQLEQALERNGVELVEGAGEATAILAVLESERERRVLSVGTDAKVTEYELIARIEISARAPAGQVILQPRSLSTRRAYSFNPDLVLGTQGEEVLLYEEMEQELIRLVLLSLQGP